MNRGARLAGIGFGCIFLALFGGYWMTLALAGEPAFYQWTGVLLPTSLLGLRGAVCIHAGKTLLRAAGPPTAADLLATRRRRRRFALVFAAECGLILLAANVLAPRAGGMYVIPAIALIVGLHFFPLARVFEYRGYALAGLVEVAGTLLLTTGLRRHGVLLDLGVGWMMGLSLWITALASLVRARRIQYSGLS